MASRYILPNIRALLTEGFTDQQLRRLCYDVPGFRPAYDQLAENTGKDVIIDRLLEHAERTLQMDQLLALAQKQNSARYEAHQPYLNRTQVEAELAKVERAIAAQEELRGILPEEQIETTLKELRARHATFQAQLTGSGTIAQGTQARAASASQESMAVSGDVGGHVIFAEQGATVVIGEAPVQLTAVDRRSDLGRYLRHIISRNHYLQLQGIRSGGKLVHIELDQIYVTLRATQQWVIQAEEAWLAEEARLAPGERRRGHEDVKQTSPLRPLASSPLPVMTETVTVSVNEALAAYPCLVVLGDPGSGKTTLLRYLALLYARDLAEETTLVREKLSL